MKHFIIDPAWQAKGYTYPAASHTVNVLLGLAPQQKLPNEGMPPRILQGFKVWVDPLDTSYRGRKRSTHRVRAECPICRKVLSVGRLQQHVCKEALDPVHSAAHERMMADFKKSESIED